MRIVAGTILLSSSLLALSAPELAQANPPPTTESNVPGAEESDGLTGTDIVGIGHVFQTMFDVSQIEVLRGHQGTLRGRASPSHPRIAGRVRAMRRSKLRVPRRRAPDADAIGYRAGSVRAVQRLVDPAMRHPT